MGFQDTQASLMEFLLEQGWRGVDPLAHDFRRGQAFQPQHAPESHIVPVGADRLEIALAQRQQGDLGGVDGMIGNGLDRGAEQSGQPCGF